MAVETTYSKLREELASFLDRVSDDREVVVVKRRNGKNVALIDADELSSLVETAYLLSSPRNAERLLSALRRSERGEGKPQTLDQLRREIGLAEKR
ncbi:MAG TPA: type II toxin-antitoxin system prevent-host-death family antitoxin [Bryobacteraceae bacterium]|jgi:antitoxin YefM|nr:type II toxin-antitoxin system prevent-host-death family antitoxin [Bryobacteraceae bacterium]